MRHLLFICSFLFCLILTGQTEEFTQFSVDITTRQDATLEVTETITVVAAGNQVKRGITRTLNRDPLGDDTDLGRFEYEVVGVTRDGVSEPFFVKKNGGVSTVYVGQEDVFLEPGSYTYVIKYRAFEQVYALDRIDEIRWPLQGGTSGTLLIRDADITIRFDRDINILRSACYTGISGSTAEDCEFSQDGNIVTFVTTKPLRPGEDMTVAASISAGYFQRPVPPTPVEKNTTLTLLVLGFAVALGYAYTSWRKYGVDPEGPPVKHEYFPPEDISPAAASYLLQRWPSANQVTASLTDLAVKGFVAIGEEERKKMFSTYDVFIIEATEQTPTLADVAPEQLALYDALLNNGPVELGGEYQKKVEKANKAHADALGEQHNDFLKEGNNLVKMLPLLGILGVTFIAAGIALATTGFGVIPMIVAAVLAVILLITYGVLIAQPSLEKVTLLNKLKGLKQYLDLSEKERKALINAPEMTKEYFEYVLPYAIALGIENNWADDLSEYLASSGQQGNAANNNFSIGTMPYLLPGFGARLGQSYGTSAVNPASSSGGGGGCGFSGGGGSVGGGGGAGGW